MKSLWQCEIITECKLNMQVLLEWWQLAYCKLAFCPHWPFCQWHFGLWHFVYLHFVGGLFACGVMYIGITVSGVFSCSVTSAAFCPKITSLGCLFSIWYYLNVTLLTKLSKMRDVDTSNNNWNVLNLLIVYWHYVIESYWSKAGLMMFL